MSFSVSQAVLQSSTSNVKLGGDEDEEVPDENEEKKGGFDFLQWLFGWILDPITAIINGIIGIVKFVINAIKFCINLPWCIKWYIFYMIGTILYLPLALLFMFFGLQKIEKKMWRAKKRLHDFIVCYTGYSVIGYSDEIRDGCFFEEIKPRKCPNANMPNPGFFDFFAELFKGLFSFSYIGVVTALSFLFFFIWFIYYFVKPWFVRLYNFLMSYTKQKVEQASKSLSNMKDNASAKVSDMKNQISEKVSDLKTNVSTKILNNLQPSSGFLNNTPAPALPDALQNLTKVVV